MKTEIEIIVVIKAESNKTAVYKTCNILDTAPAQKTRHYTLLSIDLKNALHDLAESKDLQELIAALAGDRDIRILIEPMEKS